MQNIGTKLIEIIRSLKSDAVPRPPRPENGRNDVGEAPEENNENVNSSNYQEEFVTEPEDLKKENKKYKSTKPSFIPGKKTTNKKNKEKFCNSNDDVGHANNVINTHAGGPVVTIVNSKNVHCGPSNTYYMGSNKKAENKTEEEPDEYVEKCNLITLLMEAEIMASHEYIDYISKNLGKDWRSFFRTLGFLKGRIETVEMDEYKNGVSEARYKLLLDWSRNDADGTLGHLATLLWEYGERQLVKELAILYKKNKRL